ncbi:MAG: hypothetical protein RL364_1131 [Pseudomonadota bacterium]
MHAARGSGQLLVDERSQLGFAHGAHFGGGKLATLEDHQGGNAANTELGRDVTVLVHVHLGDLHFALVGGGHFVQDGGNHFAGAAPLGPEVHNHGLRRLQDVAFKAAVGNVFDQIAGHGVITLSKEGG